MITVGPCLQCTKSSPPGARLCAFCSARLPILFVDPTPSLLNFSDQQEQYPMPETRYQTELMAKLGWAVTDFLAGTLDGDEFDGVLDELHLAFASFEKQSGELTALLREEMEKEPDDGLISSAHFSATRGLELFKEGLEKLEEALDADEDEKIMSAARLICDGNDRLAHCYRLMSSKSP